MRVGRDLQSMPILQDGVQGSFDERMGRYGEAYALNPIPDKKLLADEGCYYVTSNPTMGTAIAFAVNATYDATKTAFNMANKASANSLMSPWVYPDFIRMVPTVAPASAISAQFVIAIEPNSLGAPTAGNATAAGRNTNSAAARSSVVTFDHFTGGAVMTSPALSSASRIVGRGALRGVIPVVGDELIISFGPAGMPDSSPPSTASRNICHVAPIALGPGSSLRVILWFPSNAATGISLEFDAGWIER